MNEAMRLFTWGDLYNMYKVKVKQSIVLARDQRECMDVTFIIRRDNMVRYNLFNKMVHWCRKAGAWG